MLLRTACAWLMIALSGAMLAEQSFGINLGIDWPLLHRHVNDRNAFPGHSAPNACLGFLLALARMAQTDMLTGLNNRRHFIQLSETELSRTSRHGGPLSVLMLDIDHFKRVNDTHGHQVGDCVIQMLATICREQLRDLDVIGRLGGEEFAVTMPNADNAQAVQVAERLRQAIEAATLPVEQGWQLSFTVSIEVTTLKNGVSKLDVLLDQADQALYRAKNQGRNQVRSFFDTI